MGTSPTDNESIYSKDSSLKIDNMAIIADKETGSVLKFGDIKILKNIMKL